MKEKREMVGRSAQHGERATTERERGERERERGGQYMREAEAKKIVGEVKGGKVEDSGGGKGGKENGRERERKERVA